MNNSKLEIYLPKSRNPHPVKYMCIGAHHDDIEIMATDGILKGLTGKESFVGVVATDGKGSARDGKYALYTDAMMKECRIHEQKEAAELGCYHAVVFLNYESSQVKAIDDVFIAAELADVIKMYQPEILYTHNPFDKHTTHVKLLDKIIKALRLLPVTSRPKHLYGIEVWRDLDWLVDTDKVVFDVTEGRELTRKQLLCFDSQVAGGKRYDLATEGRRLAHSTYFESHAVDQATQIIFGVDMSVLMHDDTVSLTEFVEEKIARFKDDVTHRINH